LPSVAASRVQPKPWQKEQQEIDLEDQHAYMTEIVIYACNQISEETLPAGEGMMSTTPTTTQGSELQIRGTLARDYSDIYTPEALAALFFLAQFNDEQKRLMHERTRRRALRIKEGRPITFLAPEAEIKGTGIRVQDARDGKFVGPLIPHDLQRQWLQGTGPAARPNSPVKVNLRNVAYALLSGADGWMFDGEDALGQITAMSLDNMRSLKLAIARDPLFLEVAEQVAKEMNAWARDFFSREIISDWRRQLDFTTKIFRARGLHLDDRHIRIDGKSLSASIVDMTLYVVNNYKMLLQAGSSIVLYLPKIQTAEEAGFWNRMLTALERHLGLAEGTIKVYVLVEQLEATFQLMRSGRRWGCISSVSIPGAGITSTASPTPTAGTPTSSIPISNRSS